MPPSSSANLGFEDKLWEMADKMRGHMDASEYKHVVLGLIFLKYISDSFQAKYEDLKARQETDFTDPEDRDEYLAENVFWVPPEARWETIQAQAPQPTIGQVIDAAMTAIERENPRLKGVLPKNYSRPTLDKTRLGELVKLVGDIDLKARETGVKDPLGRVYEYFIGQFAAAEGKSGGEFYTPQCVVQLLVAMIEPYQGRVYDPCCGSGGMFVQSEKFVEEHGGAFQGLCPGRAARGGAGHPRRGRPVPGDSGGPDQGHGEPGRTLPRRDRGGGAATSLPRRIGSRGGGYLRRSGA